MQCHIYINTTYIDIECGEIPDLALRIFAACSPHVHRLGLPILDRGNIVLVTIRSNVKYGASYRVHHRLRVGRIDTSGTLKISN